MVRRHEGEGRVDPVVDHLELKLVPLRDRLPVGDARATEGVDSEPESGPSDRLHGDDHRQLVHVRGEVVAAGSLDRVFVGRSPHAVQPRPQEFVGGVLDPLVTALAAGPPWGGLYLKPPSSGGLCDGVK